MIDGILDALDPYLAEGIIALFATFFGSIFQRFFRTKESQDSLHRALETGVDTVTDYLAKVLDGHVDPVIPDWIEEKVVEYVKGSVPDAVKYLKANDDQLKLMVRGKVNARIFGL